MSTEMIKKRLKIISDLQEELNSIKETYTGMLEDDNTYQQVIEADNKLKEELKEKKAKVLAQPAIKNVDEQVKKLRQDLKENKEILSQELVEFYRESGLMEVEDSDGNIKKIKFSVTLTNQ